MKGSFYFILWILIYMLIGLSSSWTLVQNAFVVAFIVVLCISGILNKALKNQILYQMTRDRYVFLEMCYQNDYSEFLAGKRRQLGIALASFIYLLGVTILLIFIRSSIVELVIFGLFAFFTGKRVWTLYKIYGFVKKSGTIYLPTDPQQRKVFEDYFEERKTKTFQEICPKPTTKDKILKYVNVAFSIIAMLLGLAFIYFFAVLFFRNDYGSWAVIQFAYGCLALMFGVNDLTTSLNNTDFE